MKTRLKLNFTRDTTLIIQQMWYDGYKDGLKRAFDIECPYEIIGIDYVSNEVIGIWEDPRVVEWATKALLDKCTECPETLMEYYDDYELGLERMKSLWKRDALVTNEELLELVSEMERLMPGDLALLLLGINEKTPEPLKSRTHRLRSEDTFFAFNDALLRRSIARIFPGYAEYATMIKLDEIKSKLPTIDVLKRRRDKYVLRSDRVEFFMALDEYNEFDFEGLKLVMAPEFVEGLVASKGNAKGKVKILRLQKETYKIDKGDIIISPMTTPMMIPAIEKAAAIVTDEGGMISHAAIISRELGIPCIVGTKIATKIFKDGDLIEVDADKGVVRKIK